MTIIRPSLETLANLLGKILMLIQILGSIRALVHASTPAAIRSWKIVLRFLRRRSRASKARSIRAGRLPPERRNVSSSLRRTRRRR